MRRGRGQGLLLATALFAAPDAALACAQPPAPSMAELEPVARQRIESAAAVIEVTVLLVPPGGLLRVDQVLRGEAPSTIVVPLQAPCEPTFTRIGARGLVILERNGPPSGFVRGELETVLRRILQDRR